MAFLSRGDFFVPSRVCRLGHYLRPPNQIRHPISLYILVLQSDNPCKISGAHPVQKNPGLFQPGPFAVFGDLSTSTTIAVWREIWTPQSGSPGHFSDTLRSRFSGGQFYTVQGFNSVQNQGKVHSENHVKFWKKVLRKCKKHMKTIGKLSRISGRRQKSEKSAKKVQICSNFD